MLQKTCKFVKEWRGYELFCVRGFMFGDKFVKIVLDSEIIIIILSLFSYIWISNKYCRSLVGTPVTFLITQNEFTMKKNGVSN
jgi:hypothetical protein